MRTTNPALNTVLAGNSRLAADLYTFYFREGTQRWTSAPTDLQLSNMLQRSQEFISSPWVRNLMTTTTADVGVAPDGTMTADRLASTNASHSVLQVVTVQPSTQYVFSFWVKNNGGVGAKYSAWNLTAGSNIVAPTSYFSQINDSTWTRVEFSFTTPVGCTSINIYPIRDTLANVDVLLWGAQLELGATAGGYQPTTTAAVSALWSSTGPKITRGTGRTTAGLEVDTLDVALAPGATVLAGVNAKMAATQGVFDGIRVVAQRGYMTTWGVMPLPITVFDGTVVEANPGSTEVRLVVKSAISQMEQLAPRRLIHAQCPFRLYDTSCGVAIASFRTSTTAVAGSTASVVNLAASTALANAGGYLQFTSGALAGQTRTIRSAAGAAVTAASPFSGAPAAGDALYVVKGCDKTRTACRTFSNIAKFGGFPEAPKPEAGSV